MQINKENKKKHSGGTLNLGALGRGEYVDQGQWEGQGQGRGADIHERVAKGGEGKKYVTPGPSGDRISHGEEAR